MLSAGYFRIRNALPGPVWTYPISYISFHTYSIQAREFTMPFAIFFSSLHNNAKKLFSGNLVQFQISQIL